MERAYDQAKYGEFSRRPYIDMVIPTLTDPSVAPPGKHILSCFVHTRRTSSKPGSAWDDQQRDAFGNAVIDTIAEYAPNIRDIILHKQVLTPLDIERDFGLTRGQHLPGRAHAGAAVLPAAGARVGTVPTPVKNLWMCGSATHPGGGIMGAPGRNAALRILGQSR